MRFLIKVRALVLLGLFFMVGGSDSFVMGVEGSPGPLYVFTVQGAIDPVVARYLQDGFQVAREAGASGALVRLDTPGGLLEATRDIVQQILKVPFPVIVYVSPPGARAASAGLFITLASDVAAMAPQTHLGAAHPVSLGDGPGALPKNFKEKGGKTSPTSLMEEKVESDTAAYARSLAETRSRNGVWAERAVRESLSMTSEEALKAKVIDFVAKDEDQLLSLLVQGKVDKGGRVYPLDFRGAERVSLEMSLPRRILHVLAHPNVAYLLLTLGFYALVYEFASPGVGFGGVVGIISLVLAFFSLQVLPLNAAGLGLLAVGLLLMALDHFVTGHGLLVIGGDFCSAVGAFFLFDRIEPYYRVSLELVGATLLAGGVFSGYALRKIWEDRRRRPVVGWESFVGETVTVRPDGMVFMQGTSWSVDCDQILVSGDKVRVVEVVGNRLKVEI